MPIRGAGTKYKPPWWTDSLEAKKREIINLHRRVHTAKRQGLPLELLLEEKRTKKAQYADELRTESTKNFREFCELQRKENVWSLTNRLLKDSISRRPPTTLKIGDRYTAEGEETATALLDHFYPDDGPDTDPRHAHLRSQRDSLPNTAQEPPFAVEEVLEHLRAMNPKKAPGLDGLTSDICLRFGNNYPQLLSDILNRCLALQHFPRQWKEAYVKIIPKPGKPEHNTLGAFRPIGLLPVFGKLLEKLFIKRVTYLATKDGKINRRQFGFKEQTNTTEAINTALEVVRRAKAKRELAVAVSLDIKAAFDNAWWPALTHRLRKLGCPKNIFGLILSYIRDRRVTLDYAGVRVSKAMTKGCVQGSTCGPILWNIILDELLDTPMPQGCHIQAYADDVLLIATAKEVRDLEAKTNTALNDIVRWGDSVKLAFGAAKTQTIAFSTKAKTARLLMKGEHLDFKREIKLLGVIIDDKLLFRSHVRHVTGKATRIFGKLCLFSRPTWGAHPENIQTIYNQVIQPIITYAAGIWGHVAHKKYVKRDLARVQRGFAIKAIRGFRTVSTNAALALAQFVPLDLKVREVHQIEQTRLSGTSSLLPDGAQLERPTPVHELLHPVRRISVPHTSCSNQEEASGVLTNTAVQIFTDGSKQENGDTGAAFVVYEPGGTIPTATKKLKLHMACTVFQAELLAILHACEWVLQHKYPEAVILTDSMSSLQALYNRSNTHPLVAEIHKVVSEHRRMGVLKFSWVRSHVGIVGNEAADSAANEATRLDATPDYTKIPISYIKNDTRKQNDAEWQSRYVSAEQGSFTRRILPTLKDIRDLWTAAKPTFHLTQILTGHGFNKTYLKRFHITNDDACPCDGQTPQSLDHLLEDCPRFGINRLRHEQLCHNLGVAPYNIKSLSKSPGAFDSFQIFVSSILSRLKDFNGT